MDTERTAEESDRKPCYFNTEKRFEEKLRSP